MILLSLVNVSKSFVMNRVLENIDLTLHVGNRMGLIGVNGTGKTTLLKIIAGEMEPDSGTVSISRGAKVGMLTQQADIVSELTVRQELERVFDPVKKMEERLRQIETEMAEKHSDDIEMKRLSDEYSRLTDRFEESGGYEWPSRIQGVLAGLGFADDKRDQRADLLSGGEKTRLCLARLLLTQPDLLMLDEPTNHLDLASTQWLEETLKKYRGTVLVISHDRYFMNAVCDTMAEISMRRLTQYEGNYDQFMVKRRADLERQEKEYKLQQAEFSRQQAIIARYRMYNTERSIRAAESRERQLEKVERVEKPVNDKKIRFSFGTRRRTGEDVLILKNLAKSFGQRTLFHDFSLHLRQGDRVAIIGPNGVGKSTLLNIVTRQLSPDSGSVVYGMNVDVGYYDQQQSTLHNEKDIMYEVWDDFPRLEPNEVRSVLALFLFTGEDVFKKVSTLSGGERARVALSKLMLKRDNLLLLDEPTNHLDMDSREVLEGALEDFDGTILAVSHDRYFINRVADRVVELSPDGAKEYIGNYDDYLEKRRLEGEYEEQGEKSGLTKTQLEKEKRRKRLMTESVKRLEAQLKAVEDAIMSTEEKIKDVEAKMALPETYKDEAVAAGIAKEHIALTRKLDEMYDEFGELSEAVEAVK